MGADAASSEKLKTVFSPACSGAAGSTVGLGGFPPFPRNDLHGGSQVPGISSTAIDSCQVMVNPHRSFISVQSNGVLAPVGLVAWLSVLRPLVAL